MSLILITTVIDKDQFRLMGNCPPTPLLTQREHFLLTWGKMLG